MITQILQTSIESGVHFHRGSSQFLGEYWSRHRARHSSTALACVSVDALACSPAQPERISCVFALQREKAHKHATRKSRSCRFRRELQHCRGVIDNSCQRKCVTNFSLQPFQKRLRRSRRLISLGGRSNSSKKTKRGTFGRPLASKVTRCWEQQR